MPPERRADSQARLEAHRLRRQADQEAQLAEIDRQLDQQPMTGLALMGTLACVLPPRAAVVEEAITTHGNILEKLGILRDPSGHFAHRGWALGWGLGCALGVKLAWPERPVVGLLGDGAALYGIQGLWTAARENIPVTFIVCNSQYRILAVCGRVLTLPACEQATAPGLRLDHPPVDFVGMARALGVEARRVATAEELADRLRDAFRAGDRPLLIEARIA
jgi:benzoylformate decarboxylase